jgi:2-polyprenyl-6-methoxyphenol hydroxylase-like FAD-dependent oxidoreductase
MTESSPRILVVGGGLGGLCLAQGLHQSGMGVAVYERDATASARAQGYRISMDARGTEALRKCLPAALYRLFEATCGQPSTGGAMFSTDGPTLNEEGSMRFPPEVSPGVPAAGRAVDRLILRETLLAGLDGVVRFGKEFTRYEVTSAGEVRAHFADGTTAAGDLLVAADGVGSRVRGQFLPAATLIDTGGRWVGGRTVLDERLRALLPAAASDRAVWVRDRGDLLFLAPVFFRQRPNDAADALWPGLRYTDNEDFLMWALIGRKDQFIRPDRELAAVSETELHRLALEATAGGHPMLRALVEAATPDRSFYLATRALGAVDPWPSGPVTFLGDAIHAGPVNGTGANAALEDSTLLCEHLTGAPGALQSAVDAYEVELLERVRAMQAGLARYRPLPLNNPVGLGLG